MSIFPWDLCSQYTGHQAVITTEVSGGDGCSEERSIQSGDEAKQASHVSAA